MHEDVDSAYPISRGTVQMRAMEEANLSSEGMTTPREVVKRLA